MTYDKEIFPKPMKFRHERWLQENSRELDAYTLFPEGHDHALVRGKLQTSLKHG
jgi:cytochrome P450